MPPIVIKGRISSTKYNPVVDAFEENFHRDREKGSSVVCYVEGECVVELYGGRDESCLVKPDELNVAFSNSKVIESLVVAMLVDRGRLEYGERISRYWPEFGRRHPNGKNITISQLMRHRGGLAIINKPLSRAEAPGIFASREKLEAWLLDSVSCEYDENSPRKQGYHPITRGIYVDVLVRRVDELGRSLKEFVHEEIYTFLKKCNKENEDKFVLHVGVPEELQDRMVVAEELDSMTDFIFKHIPLRYSGILDRRREERRRALGLPPGGALRDEHDDEFYYEHLTQTELETSLKIAHPFDSTARKMLTLIHDIPFGISNVANDRVWRSLPLASSSCCTNSYTLASITNELVNGEFKLLSAEGLEKALRISEEEEENNDPRNVEVDRLFGEKITFTACGWGFQHIAPDFVGWAGAGGGLLQFSFKYRSAYCYTPTGLDNRMLKPNGWRVLKALRDSI